MYHSDDIGMALNAQPVGNTGGQSYLYLVDDDCGLENNIEDAAVLKYQRTEYGKQIRKDYETGKIKERRCNMRECVPRKDGISNTLTTVLKDNYLIVAMRGRYDTNGNIHQQLEPQYDRVCNTLTSVTKDNLVLEG